MTTADRRWVIERSDEPGTPWIVYVGDTGESVGTFRTKRQARAAVGSGLCETVVDRQRRDRIAGWEQEPDQFKRLVTAEEQSAEKLAQSTHPTDRRNLARIGPQRAAWADAHLGVLNVDGSRDAVRSGLERIRNGWTAAAGQP